MDVSASGGASLSPTSIGKISSDNVFFQFPSIIVNANCNPNADCISSVTGA